MGNPSHEKIDFYLSHKSFQSIFPRPDIHRTMSADWGTTPILSENTRVGLQEVYERFYCSRSELNSITARARRIASVHQKVRQWKTKECHANQVRQRVHEMEARQHTVNPGLKAGQDSPTARRVLSAPVVGASRPFVRTSSPVGQRADEIRRKWREEISSVENQLLAKEVLEKLKRPEVSSFPSEESSDTDTTHDSRKHPVTRLRSSGDCDFRNQAKATSQENKSGNSERCTPRSRANYQDMLFTEPYKLDPITAAASQPAPYTKQLKTVCGAERHEPHPYCCPPPMDALKFVQYPVEDQLHLSSVAFPQQTQPVSAIDLYCCQKDPPVLVQLPLYHPNTYKTEHYKRFKELFKDPLPPENLQDHPRLKEELIRQKQVFGPCLRVPDPLKTARKNFVITEIMYPIEIKKYQLSPSRSIKRAN